MDWIIPCNIKYYDVIGAFNKFDVINWKQSTNIEAGDIVYIYIGKPYSSIKYKCIATKADIREPEIDDKEFVIQGDRYTNYGRYMEIKLLKEFDDEIFSIYKLKENGLKSIQGPLKITLQLRDYIKSMEEKQNFLMKIDKKTVLMDKVREYQATIEKYKETEKRIEKLRLKFTNDYKIKQIIDLKLEEYVVGMGKKDTFCYRIETELDELGDIHGSPAIKFGVYFGIRGGDKKPKYHVSESKYGKNPNKALEIIKEQIINLLIDGGNQEYEKIRKSLISPMFRGKILSTYYPDKYISIFSEEHLNYFLNKLEVDFSINEDDLDKQLKLMNWKASNSVSVKWSMYSFVNFLYDTFGKPKNVRKILEDRQNEHDKNYPRKYILNLKINVKQWKELLENPDIFMENDIKLLKRIYSEDNHSKPCYELGVEDGLSADYYIKQVTELAKRIVKKQDIESFIKKYRSETLWRIPFWGKFREDGNFEWKIRPELAKALQQLYPELDYTYDTDFDNKLIEDLKTENFNDITPDKLQHKGIPRKKQEAVLVNGRLSYPRDKSIAKNALAYANFECEIDEHHPTFIRKNTNKKYTEPHHLVPLAFSDRFEVSLDVEENIVSLCSNCHNQLHYGKDAERLIIQLFNDRNALLKKVGINIELTDLLKIYL